MILRLLIISIFLIVNLNAQDDIEKKIQKTSTKLNSFNKSYAQINKKMAKVAEAILKQKEQLYKQSKYLDELKEKLKAKENDYRKNKKKLKALSSSQAKLLQKQQKIEENLLFFISKSISLSLLLEDASTKTADNLIEEEVLKSMLEDFKQKAKKLNEDFFLNAKNIDELSKRVQVLKDAILEIEHRRAKIKKVHEQNKKALAKLNKDREKYKKALKNLLRKQDTLKKTLAGLNIIKIDKKKREKEKRERELAFKRKQQMQKKEYKQINSRTISSKNLPKVKRYADSYQAVKTRPYRGPKTIAPLKDYIITKKYGTYTDPIYGIKIFNESISLKPKRKNAKVRNVFNGKVIYADKTAVLNNIVIVENRGGIHTIYANLSKIAPNIKKGFRIRKGYVIGRVEDELVFEVTQKSYHINPIRLFK